MTLRSTRRAGGAMVSVDALRVSASDPTRLEGPGIEALMASLTYHGQVHPVLAREDGVVIEGRRVVAAARRLGWTGLLVQTPRGLREAVELIRARESTAEGDAPGPTPRTYRERAELGILLETLPHSDYPNSGGTVRRRSSHVGLDSWEETIGQTVHLGASTSYKRVRQLVRALADPVNRGAAIKALELVERTGQPGSGYTLYRKLRDGDSLQHFDSGDVEIGDDGLPVLPPPHHNARSRQAIALRTAWLHALIAKGATAEQIADRMDWNVDGVRQLAKRVGVEITASRILKGTQRKERDSNRVMEVIADDLDALVWSLGGVEVDELDPGRLAEWEQLLRKHGTAISRVGRRLKERLQEDK